MKNTDVEARLNTAVENAVPDVLDSILSRCPEREGKVIEMKAAVSPSWIKPLCATAAALALIVGGMLGASGYRQSRQAEAVISLEVNPGIELEINKKDEVLAARGLNSDGEKLIAKERAEGTKLEGARLETAVSALVGTMVDDGYLSEYANSVLVTVSGKNTEKSISIEQSLMVQVDTAMTEKGVDGAIIGQSVINDEKLEKTAQELGVSTGKASLINEIIAQNPRYKAADLAKLSINALCVLSADSIDKTENVQITGSPSTKGYVSAEAAVNGACAKLSTDLNDTVKASTKIGVENGALVYNVDLTLDSEHISCTVDAITGKVLSWAKELIGSSGKTDADDDDADKKESDAETPHSVGGAVGSIIDGVVDGVGSVVDGTIDGVGSVVGGVADGVGDIVGSAADGIGGVIDSTADGVGDVLDTTIDGVGSIVDAAINDPAKVEDTAKDSAGKIADAADGLVDKATNAAGKLVDSLPSGTGSTTGGTTGGTIGGIISSILS